MKNPRTPFEWQQAVDSAEAWLALDSARKYGLVTGGPPVNVDRCQEILAAGRARGVQPAADCLERFVASLQAEPPDQAARS